MTKFKKISILAAMLLAGAAYSQTKAWEQDSILTGTGLNVSAVAMTEDSSGYLYVVGTRQQTSSSKKNVVVLKINPSNGSLIASQELGGSDVEIGYDIKFYSSYIYVLGQYDADNGANSQQKLFVVKLNTSLQTQWQNWAQPGTTSCVPYRLDVAANGSGLNIFACGTVGNSVFAAKFDDTNSGSPSSTTFAPTGSGSTANPLFGAYAFDNGFVVVTESKDPSATANGKIYYSKLDTSLSSQWTTSPITTPSNTHNTLFHSMNLEGTIYTSSGAIRPFGFQNQIDWDFCASGSGTGSSAPSLTANNFSHLNPAGFGGINNQGLGVVYWNSSVVSVGRWTIGGGSASSDDPNVYGSYLRTLGGTEVDVTVAANGDDDKMFVPENNQRSVDANSSILALARGTGTNQYWLLTEKGSISSYTRNSSHTKTLATSGYSLLNGKVTQVFCSKVNTTDAYVLMTTVDGSGNQYVGLVKYQP